jgi:prepilin-type N-terminal cleavage/methylation domain-containing protein
MTDLKPFSEEAPMKTRINRPGGFTLIELLIVIAIILILIAIALPNFLEAQLRAKVTKANSEIRTLATALESYQIDWRGQYPLPADEVGVYPSPGADPWFDQTLPVVLSTPVAYITDARIRDSFNQVEDIVPHYHYSTREFAVIQNDEPGFDAYVYSILWTFRRNAQYFLLSHGPNLDHDPPSDTENPDWRNGMQYSPTNGSTSKGDIVVFGPTIGKT